MAQANTKMDSLFSHLECIHTLSLVVYMSSPNLTWTNWIGAVPRSGCNSSPAGSHFITLQEEPFIAHVSGCRFICVWIPRTAVRYYSIVDCRQWRAGHICIMVKVINDVYRCILHADKNKYKNTAAFCEMFHWTQHLHCTDLHRWHHYQTIPRH